MIRIGLTVVLLATFLLAHAQTVSRYAVVIDEIMADPTPVVGLPDAEYIELKNVSGSTVNLQGFKLATSTATSGAFATFLLPADSFVIITSTTRAALLAPFGRVLGVAGFPSLDNSSTTISLLSKEGNTIHAVRYHTATFNNAVKEAGGWSMEMKDTKSACITTGNWQWSTDAKGGTPGKTNSINGTINNTGMGFLKSAYVPNATTIILNFDVPLDSSKASLLQHYTIAPAVNIASVSVVNPLLQQVQLKLATSLSAATFYTITATGIFDCKGNAVNTGQPVVTGMPQVALPNDIVINEILFNPRPAGFDYVELYNRSNKIIDAATLYIGNRTSSGNMGSVKKLSDVPFYLLPGSYLLITEDTMSVAKQYLVKNKDALLQLSTLPAYPDKEGTVVLTNMQGVVVDEVHYKDDWHFNLMADKEGVALERIDPNGPSQEKSNWHSAATTAGYGTPGYQNSQYKLFQNPITTIQISPAVFSPDNDGVADVATISYLVTERGYVANIIIFDAAGRQVRHLVKNALLGLSGNWVWDGLDEKNQRLPIGTYVVYIELFNLQGKKQVFKKPIVLARRLQ